MMEEAKKAPTLDFAYESALLQQQEEKLDEKIEAQQKLLEADLTSEAHLQQKQAIMQQMAKLHTDMEDMNSQLEQKKQMMTDLQDPERMKEILEEVRTEYGQTVRQLEDMINAGESDYKICYLTFDDGPTYYTPDFLDELKEHDVYATFFTIGKSMPEAQGLRNTYLRREAREGHTIANHTYTHAINGSLYKSTANFMDAVKRQDDLVYKVTGIHTDIVRFPAGSYYNPYRKSSIKALTDAGYGWMDWIGNAFDSGDNNYSASRTAKIVINQARQEEIIVVLMHDWKKNTLGALDEIITTLQAENYLFLPLFKESVTNGNCTPKWDD
jgi:peptidoglycan/xylan/chitin deacetylase (PgdA/CDA1 family)